MLFLDDEKWTVKLKMADVIDFIVGLLIYIYNYIQFQNLDFKKSTYGFHGFFQILDY